MSDLSQPNYQSLTIPIDYQNSHLYNPYMGSLFPTNLNGTKNVSIPNLNLGTPFLIVDLNPSLNLQIYQPNTQCMSLQQNNIIPSNQYMPNVSIPNTNLPNINISNPHLVNYGIDMFANHTNVVQNPKKYWQLNVLIQIKVTP